MKCFMLFMLALFTTTLYAQRSSWNKEDRKYLCDKLNAYLDALAKRLNSPLKQNLWNENDPRILGDTFSMSFKYAPEHCDHARSAWNKMGVGLAMGLYVNALKEFPQYRAIQLFGECIEKQEIKMTYLIMDGGLVYYDEESKKWLASYDHPL